ncbi:helix-turn-helix transcriptional regulator [Clostridium sp. UBA871]|uniref:helix-turn-helix domain-containing protein n=1 Tax=Clostridium sp. UBA871 TaxID=1946380 RepID=UPI0032169491
MIGDNIKRLRIYNGWTQNDLANKSGVSRVSIGNYERNDRTPPADILNKISIALGVSVNDLLENDLNFSKKIIDSMEIPILKSVGFGDTLEIISEDLNIEYKLLESCVYENNELPIDIQEKLLEAFSCLDFPSFLKFIEKYKDVIQKSDRLDKFISELFVKNIYDIDQKSLEILKSYILLVFSKDITNSLDDNMLEDLQKELRKFIEFKLYEYMNKNKE